MNAVLCSQVPLIFIVICTCYLENVHVPALEQNKQSECRSSAGTTAISYSRDPGFKYQPWVFYGFPKLLQEKCQNNTSDYFMSVSFSVFYSLIIQQYNLNYQKHHLCLLAGVHLKEAAYFNALV
jgi:hypothetical protein